MTLLDSQASVTATASSAIENKVRAHCRGILPLTGNLIPWMETLLEGERLHTPLEQHGSPLNIVCAEPFRSNVDTLRSVAEARDLDFQIYFARKANKCLAFVAAAKQLGIGVDVASGTELSQTLAAGLPAESVVCTAAVKDSQLLELCLTAGVTLVIDNLDEWRAAGQFATQAPRPFEVALRLSGFEHCRSKLPSRFGLDIDRLDWFLHHAGDKLCIAGIQFHLDGYSADERVSAIRQSLAAIDRLVELGHPIRFLDIGGGLPVCYLRSRQQWDDFWQQHTMALEGRRPEITYRNHPLGRTVVEGRVAGRPDCYPYYQQPTMGDWLASILDAQFDQGTIATAIRSRELQLRCEPGRALMDGCGITIARVAARKQLASGDWAILLSMNGTQCRTSSADFLVDPLLVPCPAGSRSATEPMEGYLVGSRCMESDLILERKLSFPQGVAVGDLVVLPNTGGYLMHFLESATHQFPLARNLVFDAARRDFALDAIDRSHS